ncbi:MAG: hypothetical protein P1U63_08815 [Coxiellaceae bacterium]|nr:hypothetical protein [Coxiellaceae bacterium]
MKAPIKTLMINFICFIATYYIAIILHEYGHGFVAWLYGIKDSPFDVIYGGWYLQNVDEGVSYHHLRAIGALHQEAFIGIGGTCVTLFLALLSLLLLNCKSVMRKRVIFTFLYWLLIINMVALTQYFFLSVFADGGDMGHHVHGLKISPWWVFIPGTIFIAAMLYRIFSTEILKAYVIMPLQSIWTQRLLLLLSLATIFLMLYLHQYNPISDNKGVLIDQVLAVFSIFLVPILFFVFNPSNQWVKQRLARVKVS